MQESLEVNTKRRHTMLFALLEQQVVPLKEPKSYFDFDFAPHSYHREPPASSLGSGGVLLQVPGTAISHEEITDLASVA